MLSNIPNATYAAQLNRHAMGVERAMERLSSGTRLNKTWEDPADFAMAENIGRQRAGASEVTGVIQDAINVLRIGQDGVQGIVDVVQKLRDTVVEAANGVYTPEQQAIFQQDLDTQRGLLVQAYTTAKNFRVRLDGVNGADRVLHFQVGTGAGEVMSVDYNPLRDDLRELIMGVYGYEDLYNDPDTQEFLAGAFYPIPLPTDIVPPPPLGPAVPPGTTFAEAFPKKVLVDPQTDANIASSFAVLDRAKEQIVAQESYLGTCANRLEQHLASMQQFELDMAMSESSIRDTDMAAESAAMTKAQVLQQASQAMLAQANTRSLQVLELLRQ
jgi:flagellin